MTLLAILLLRQLRQPGQTWVDPRSKVSISFKANSGIFPDFWVNAPISAKATPLQQNQEDKCIKLAAKALDRYPAKFLQSNLKTIYFLNSISFYGQPYGGTNSLDAVYCTDNPANSGYTDIYLEGCIHHEFSSIILRNFAKSWDSAAWKAALPVDFHYLGDGVQALRDKKAGLTYDPALCAKGFVCQYSEASAEEDFNMTVQGMFVDEQKFWKVADANPKLLKKVHLIIKFYATIEPFFTETVFRRATQAASVPTKDE